MPQGAATSGLQVGTLLTQTDVKNRWPDGSIKFAVVTAKVPSAGAYAITATSLPNGSFAPAIPAVTATFTIGGVSYTAVAPALAPSDLWLSGPLAHEGRAVVAPVSGTSGIAHAFLRVNVDRRVYVDGGGRVDVSVENILNQSGATTVTYDVSIRVNGSVVYTKTAVKHFYLTRWRKTFPVGGAALAAITPDITPFNLARVLPPYLSLVSSVVSTPSGAAFDILAPGALNADMPAHGGRAELAPYPDWTARYLVHRNTVQRAYVLANGDLSGSWPIHLREPETGVTRGVGAERLVSLDQRPTFWYDERAQSTGYDYVRGTPLPIREYSGASPTALQTALTPDNAHQPSLAYVPYLLTGDRYYAEEMAFWANYSMLRTYNGDGVRGAQGVLANNETRGYAWALRNLSEAAALYPDASPVKAYLSQKTTNNLQWLDAYANAQNPTTNPFRILWLGSRPDGTQYISMWEQNYLAYAIDRANKLGFTGGLAHRDAIAKFQIRLLSSDPEYPRLQGAPYVVAVGTPKAGLSYDDYATFSFYTTMSQIWTATQGNERAFAGYYGPESRLSVMMGVEGSWAGARAAYDYLWPFIGVQPYWGSLPDLAERAGWALDFYGATPPPPPPPPPTLPAPTVTAVSPAAGPIAGGTNVTITGANFAAGARVSIGEVPAINITVVNATRITATSPPHIARPANVVVTNPDAQSGSLLNGFTYLGALPTITAIAPAAGLIAGGTPITIAGSGFAAGATVTLGGVAAINVTVLDAGTITARTGAHAAGTVSVIVTNPDTQAGRLTNGFTYATASPPSPPTNVRIVR